MTAHHVSQALELTVQVPDPYGVGIMVSCDDVREALMDETLKDQRERAARELADREARERAPIEEASMASEFDRFEDLAKQLVKTPKRRADDG